MEPQQQQQQQQRRHVSRETQEKTEREPGFGTDQELKARRPPLHAVLLANVQSLGNKSDEVSARIGLQRDIRGV